VIANIFTTSCECSRVDPRAVEINIFAALIPSKKAKMRLLCKREHYEGKLRKDSVKKMDKKPEELGIEDIFLNRTRNNF
jgi:hypothetical protein